MKIGWYEHAAIWSFASMTLAYSLLFKLELNDSIGLFVVALGLALIYIITGFIWIRKTRSSGSTITLYIATLIWIFTPVMWLISFLSLIPSIVFAGVGGALVVGVIFASSLLDGTSQTGLWKIGSAAAAVLYAGGLLAQSYYVHQISDLRFGLFASARDRHTIHLYMQRIWYGTLASLAGALVGATVTYLARADYIKTTPAEEQIKGYLVQNTQPTYGTVGYVQGNPTAVHTQAVQGVYVPYQQSQPMYSA